MTETLMTYQLLQQLLAHTPDLVFFKDRDSRYLEFNDALVRLTGVPREVLLGRNTSSFLPTELTEQILLEDQRVMASRQPSRSEQWVEFADGQLALMDTVIAPIEDASGEVVGLMGIGRDITKYMDASIALNDKNLALEKANRELDSFIYHAAHDLRAPLTSLRGLIDLMREEQDAVRLQKMLDIQQQQIDKMDAFIQEIVNLSKNKHEGLQVGKVDLQAMFQGMVEQFRFLPGAARMAFEFTAQDDTLLYNDAFRLSLVMRNLVSNGVRYHDPAKDHPFLRLAVQIDPQKAILRLQDNGMGIAEEHLSHIFEMFYRAHKESKGSGIGLYIAHETLQRLGGNMHVESALGQGTTFIVEIPNHSPTEPV